MRAFCKKFTRDESGLAFLEFALTLPFLLALFLGSVEVTRYILIAQKVEKVAVSVADIVSQSTNVSASELDMMLIAAGEVMRPYAFAQDGYVIISSISKTGSSAPKINWQHTGGGSFVRASRVGNTGGTAQLPAGFTMIDKETIIITEVYYRFTPMVGTQVMDGGEIYKFGLFKPRLGDLNVLAAGGAHARII